MSSQLSLKTLAELWKFTILEGQFACILKQGQKRWEELEQTFLGVELVVPVNEEIKNLVDAYYRMGDDVVKQRQSRFEYSGIILHNMIERDHFLVQHFRIPCKENYSLTLAALMQIAYNAGQFKIMIKEYDPIIVRFYEEHQLDKIETYIGELMWHKVQIK